MLKFHDYLPNKGSSNYPINNGYELLEKYRIIKW